MFKPDKSPKDNCITECKYYYYFNIIGQYKCTVYPQCPDNAINLIEEKNKFIDDCIKDDTYKYQYNGKCFTECPEGTFNENYICKAQNTEICTIKINDLNNFNLKEENGA